MATARAQALAELQRAANENVAIATTFNNTTNVCTTVGHGYANGDVIKFATDNTLPAELSAGVDYFVRDVAGNGYKVAATRGGSEIDFTDDGTGNHTSQEVSMTPGTNHAAIIQHKIGWLRPTDGTKSDVKLTENGKKEVARLTAAGYLT